ncbi:mannitol dehydrogenase family protein [Devosia sp. 63-57]|uniref:mannitol dehydrogenase family protein n=1 Tax=Devosia sp. 63-57 TaxID=1895751 RepID=UPI00086EA2EF|nr:mannitol dehydrogenase family protein [Devosia sp. 63-57]ODT50960.1 MAG: mannitol dehydrogenase [Pelagibacterium sp. SCN 63-126]ODU85498.1 MAG: mannitol dehydrogenase [Pelagibacterium sp. SCN 63-17]OJX44381.1 MAG: mannitol dehydrogenase [Devosia sp. 63-57]
MPHLSLATLSSITSAAAPSYSRADLSPGIVHFGVGNFHRAHQAVYLDALFNAGEGHDWAIIGAGTRASDAAMRDALRQQDWLTTVVEQEADSSSAHITGVMVDYLEPGDSQSVIAALTNPAIRIVSLTITEGGYYIDPASQKFDPTHPDIAWDAAHFDTPKTAFGLILAGLMKRRDAGIAPFTVMSCDNIPGNGHVTQNAIAGLAALIDPTLAEWVKSTVAFPNGMVDRITPATSDREKKLLAEQFGIGDGWPVFCESFKQWVLEDNFPAGRPALEKVGVQFVDDVAPYEHMKIRILNGGHATIAYPAGLMDVHFVHEAMEHPLVSAFLKKVESEEIIPIVPPVPDTDLNAYFALCERRFSNPKIGDTIRRLALDGSNRQPKFIIPSALDRVRAGASVTGLALVSALWCRYCYGTTESGAVIEPNDPNWQRLTAQAKRAKDDPRAWLEMSDIYGDLAQAPAFAAAFGTCLDFLWTNGTRATLEAYLANRL